MDNLAIDVATTRCQPSGVTDSSRMQFRQRTDTRRDCYRSLKSVLAKTLAWPELDGPFGAMPVSITRRRHGARLHLRQTRRGLTRGHPITRSNSEPRRLP